MAEDVLSALDERASLAAEVEYLRRAIEAHRQSGSQPADDERLYFALGLRKGWAESSVNDLEMSVATATCLHNARIRTLGDLVALTPDELLAKTRRKSVKEIRALLAETGLRLRGDGLP